MIEGTHRALFDNDDAVRRRAQLALQALHERAVALLDCQLLLSTNALLHLLTGNIIVIWLWIFDQNILLCLYSWSRRGSSNDSSSETESRRKRRKMNWKQKNKFSFQFSQNGSKKSSQMSSHFYFLLFCIIKISCAARLELSNAKNKSMKTNYSTERTFFLAFVLRSSAAGAIQIKQLRILFKKYEYDTTIQQ